MSDTPEMHPGAVDLWVDGHVDLPYFMMKKGHQTHLSHLEEGPFTLEKAKRAGIGLFCTALYCEDAFNGQASFDRFQAILRFTLERFDGVKMVKTQEDLKGLQQGEAGPGTLLLLENGDALAGNLSAIETLREQGIFTVGLTHQGKNRLADGNGVTYPDGLSHQGIEVILALQDEGIIIDVAHLHPQCFWQLLKIYEGPIITSHTGLRPVCNTPRNIDMNQAREILMRGGMVGITFNPEMLSPEGDADIERLFVHLDTYIQAFGPEGIGMGSDFCGFTRPASGLEDITKLHGLEEIMEAHGYGKEGIRKVLGLNWQAFFEKIL